MKTGRYQPLRLAALMALGLALSGCVYAPPPGYAYAPAPAYYGPAYYQPYYYPPPVYGSIGVFGRFHFH